MEWQFALEYVPSSEPSDLFVSYARDSAGVVDDVLNALSGPTRALLSQKSYKTFRDIESIRSGNLWDQALIEAIFKTRVLMVFLSQSYYQSPVYMFELMLFMNRHFATGVVREMIFPDGRRERSSFHEDPQVLPYRVEPCEIPVLLKRVHAPLIPTARPLPELFLQYVRDGIVDAVREAMIVKILSSKPIPINWNAVGRDRRGLNYPLKAAKSMLALCDVFSQDPSLDSVSKSALAEVKEQTLSYIGQVRS